ncbi:MAG: TraR/DksA family transcriptional regulator [Halioglobus sp.]
MEKNQLDIYRKALITLREELGQLITDSRDAAATVTLDQSMVGRLSRMDAMQAQQMAQETARRRQLQLQKIDNALRHIDAGDYGHCFKCGDELTAARLNFDPASTRCVGCMDN